MNNWVMSIVRTLQAQFNKCTDSRCTDGLLLVSTITVLCIVHKIVSIGELSEQDCSAVALLLRESYRPEQKTCQAYVVLEKYIPTDYRYTTCLACARALEDYL